MQVLVSLRNCLISVLPICCNVGITSLILIILIVCDLGICHYLYPTSFEPNQGQGILKKFSDWGTSIFYITLTSLPLVTHEDCTCNSIYDLNVNRIEKDFKKFCSCKVYEACLPEYLQHKKSQGYTLVGVEQTANSVSLNDFRFPTKTLLLLG